MAIDQDPTQIPAEVLSFDARRGPLFRLLLGNACLTVITLGIYRFWAKTKVRRFFWQHVQFLDDPLEYTGTGGELFLGFLIVIAVLFPIGLVYSVIGIIVPPDAEGIRIALEVMYYLVLFALLQIGFYRMWRYRMSRTTWRGVRFGLDGSSWAYLRLVTIWTLLNAVTLGLAYPWMKVDLWRYQARHTRLGRETFQFEGNAKELLIPWLCTLLPTLAILVSWGIFFSMLDGELADALLHASQEEREVIGILGIASGVGAVISMLAFAYYRIRQARLQISGLRLGEARFRSELPFARLVGFAVLSFLGFAILLGAPALAFIGPAQGIPTDPSVVTSAIIAIIVILFVAWPIIWITLFGFELARQLVMTTEIANPHVLERASQSHADTPNTGEGLADALDIGGF